MTEGLRDDASALPVPGIPRSHRFARSRPLTLREGGVGDHSVQDLPLKATATGSNRAPRPGASGRIRCPFWMFSWGSRRVCRQSTS